MNSGTEFNQDVVKKLAIVISHPIQYYAPLFKMLAQRKIIKLKVFYTFSQTSSGEQIDPGFQKIIEWDIPLLEGYDYEFVENIAARPGTYHFNGIVNPTLIKAINEWKPDFILVYGWSFKSHLKCLRYFKGKIPVLFRGDSTLLNDKYFLKALMRKCFLSWVYKHIDYALYVGTSNKAYYLSNGIKQRQLFFAPHAVDNARFDDFNGVYEKIAREKRKKLQINDEDIVFLYAGKLMSLKNIDMLVNAFLRIGESKVRLLIVGNGDNEDLLKEMAKGDSRIHFIPFQNQTDMPWVYRMGDVFILPSNSETWGLSVNEAMASSRAIMVSDKCGCAVDLVVSAKNGYIFKSNSLLDLIEKMKLMMDRKLVYEMGEQSNHIIKNWSFEKICVQIEQLTLSKSDGSY